VRLSELRGEWVVLYFYPKDDTRGCTIEACGFRDTLPQFGEGAIILGVSPDPVDSHVAFREKFELPFPLLADEDHAVAELYGVWKEKQLYGKRYWGVERTTFLIDEEGAIRRIWSRVIPEGHAEEVAEALRSLL
jgi:peroxiredoxin Q/BCP